MSDFEQLIGVISTDLGRAEQLMQSGKHQEAVDVLKQALSLTEQTHTESMYKPDCLEKLGEACFELANYSQSAQYDVELLSMLDKNPLSNVRTKIRALARIGDGHSKMGYQVKSEEFLSRAADQCEKSLAPDDPLYVHTLERYERALAESGKDKRKLQQVRDRLATATGAVGKESLARSVPVMKAIPSADLVRKSEAQPDRAEAAEPESADRKAHASALRQKESRYMASLLNGPYIGLAIIVVALAVAFVVLEIGKH